MSGFVAVSEWDAHYAAGRNFRPVMSEEQAVFERHVGSGDGLSALDVGCGSGCFGKDRVPRRSCRFTRRLSLGVVSRCDEPSCSFPETPL